MASVGFPPTYLPFTRYNPALKTFRHAVALDERRIKFSPYLYRGATPTTTAQEDVPASSTTPHRKGKHPNRDEREEEVYQKYLEFHPERAKQPTDALEVWFAGCHSGERDIDLLLL